MTNTNTLPRPRVSFSQISELALTPRDKLESKWYTEEDCRTFNQALLNDIHRLRNVLAAATPDDTIAENDLYECVGIEIYLSSSLLRLAEAKKREHADAVLVEHRSRRENDDYLSQVSKNSSRWARQRAHQLATKQSNHFCLNDGDEDALG